MRSRTTHMGRLLRGIFVFMGDYSVLLRDPRWQKKRLEIFERDNWTCTKCSDTMSTLAIHHLYYVYNYEPWDYPDSALVTVCELCHEKYEFLKWIYRVGIPNLSPNFIESDLTEIHQLIENKVWQNRHPESSRNYMNDIKILCHA